MKTQLRNNLLAFTLIELIIVIAIISILAAAIFVAIDPARRLHEARNARRSSDVATLLEAIKSYQADNGGNLPTVLDPDTANALADDEYALIGTGTNNLACRDASSAYTTTSAICTAADSPSAGAADDDCVDLSAIGSNYLKTIPRDPQQTDNTYTQYYVMRDSNGAITVGSCDEEAEGAGGGGTTPTIEVAR